MSKEESKEKSLSPKLSKKKEKRDKLIRIRSYNYDRLAKLGTISEDFGDVVFWVVKHYASCPRARGEKEGQHD